MDVIFKNCIPWQIKIIAKIVLSRLPLSYSFWERLALFKHGAMEDPEYALRVFFHHYNRADFSYKSTGFVGLELGPGDSLFSAVVAKVMGASKVYLVDVGTFSRTDLTRYRSLESYLKEQGHCVERFANCRTAEDFLKESSAHYLTDGLASLREIPQASVDFTWSQAVLEHIRRDEFLPVLRELRRIQRLDGVGSHRIDLRDHLGGALNNLRFRERTWESNLLSSSGFYTNRIRFSEMQKHFIEAGFRVEVTNIERWERVPTACRKMSAPFRSLPEEELNVSGFDVLLH